MSDDVRTQLLAKRDELLRRLTGLEEAFEGRGDEADIALDGCSRDFHLARRESLLKMIRAIDVALERLAVGTYGVCLDCGGRILPARLRAIPDADRCRDCQTKVEVAAAAAGARDRRPTPYPADE